MRERFAGGKPDRPEDVVLAAVSAVGLLFRPSRGPFPEPRIDDLAAGVAFGRHRPHLVEADDYKLGSGSV